MTIATHDRPLTAKQEAFPRVAHERLQRCARLPNGLHSSNMQPATLPMAVDLPQNHRSLNACQKLLGFGQGQTQARDIAKTFRPADLYQIGAQAAVIIAGRN